MQVRHLELRWLLVVVWVTLPFTLGPLVGDALSSRSLTVQRVDSIGLWIAWLGGLIALLVPTTVSLTALRVLTPGVPLVAAVALLTADRALDTPVVMTGIIVSIAAVVLGLNRSVAHHLVNGSSYGDERRFLLRAPAPLLLGPIELAWAVLVAAFVAGPALLAAASWLLGVAGILVGWPVAALLARSMHGLSRRWLVFVPTGMVVHDYAALVDSLLLPRREIAAVSMATSGSDALDLTIDAAGRNVRIDCARPASVLPRPTRRPGSGAEATPVEATAVIVAPARALAAVEEARRRGFSRPRGST